MLLYLSRGSADGPAAVHSCLVESPSFEARPLWLGADGLMMGQGGGTVSYTGVSPHSHLVYRPCCQVCGCKHQSFIYTQK